MTELWWNLQIKLKIFNLGILWGIILEQIHPYPLKPPALKLTTVFRVSHPFLGIHLLLPLLNQSDEDYT
jgi:hypothetical protein